MPRPRLIWDWKFWWMSRTRLIQDWEFWWMSRPRLIRDWEFWWMSRPRLIETEKKVSRPRLFWESRYSLLMRHIRYKHTKEKPHSCTECDYKAVQLSKLKRHLQSHSKSSYKCRHCSYISRDSLMFNHEVPYLNKSEVIEIDSNIPKTEFLESEALEPDQNFES